MNRVTEKYDSYLNEKYYRVEHESGMEIYIIPKDFAASYGMLTVKYGSADNSFKCADGTERNFPEGIAHYLEHKMFDNADGTDTFEKFAEYGAYCNAYTSYDRTAYLFSATESHNECLVELLRFVFSPYFTAETVEKERSIIEEEIKMGDDSPARQRFYLMAGLMYGHDHPVTADIAGTEESILRITHNDLLECYNAFYVPENMILTLSGVFDPEKVLEICDGCIPQRPASPQKKRIGGKDLFGKRAKGIMQVSKPQFSIGFKDNAEHLRGTELMRRSICVNMVTDILFGESSAFYGELLNTGLADQTDVFFECAGGIAFAYLQGASNDPEKVYALVVDTVKKLKENGISQEEFLRARKGMISDLVGAFNSTEEICELFADCAICGCGISEYSDMLRGILPCELEKAAISLFDENNAVMAVVEDKKQEEI